MKADALHELGWRREALGQGLAELARRAGLSAAASVATPCPPGAEEAWLDWAAGTLGVEAEAVAFPAARLGEELSAACPAVLRLGAGEAARYLLLLRARGGRIEVLAPDLALRPVAVADLREAACAALEAPLGREIDRLLDLAAVAPAARGGARAAMLRERLGAQPVAGCWLLRLPPGAPFAAQARRTGLPGRLAGILALFAVLYGLEIAAWAVIGEAALGGRIDMGWLVAWLLLVLSNVPLRLASRWLNATFALDLGRLVKARLLAGALAIDTDTIRRDGVGQLLGRVAEAQALESLALNGGLGVLIGGLELVFAAWVLAIGAGGMTHLGLLLLWLGVTLVMVWRYARQLRGWSDTRVELTNDLVEAMVGHRTRLAQEWPARRDAREDAALSGYLHRSRMMDRSMVPVAAIAAGGWMLLGLAGLAPAFVSGGGTALGLAIGLGGVMLANRALAGIGGGLAGLARAGIAWRQVGPLFRAAATRPSAAPFRAPGARAADPAAPLVDASDLSFRYRPDAAPVLRGLDLTVRHGERILLEGASGGGKSTLAALLTGLRVPGSGLLLLDGLDRPTLGETWHDVATAAPQFHENHIFAGTLAFNLLMGREWPASEEAIAEARTLCVELGLGDLLERMPAGMLQQVGETGWQLSHGERSRVFLARALLQGAELTVLDESFAALDPQTLRLCLDCAVARARTLVVIAHP